MTKKIKKLKIAIAGLGTVGKGVYDILKKDHNLILQRTNTHIEIIGVSSRNKKDFVNKNIKFYDDILQIAQDPEVDVVVELMGGKSTAKDLIFQAIKNNKKVVTANKALLAEDSAEIIDLLKNYNSTILFEASVAGANPIIKAFREGFVANEIKEIYAILNGTCNFILTKMRDEKSDYTNTLKQAQELGFAEADPTFDVEGIDTAHKIVLLSNIANSEIADFKKIYIEGISKINDQDIELSDQLGYKIKLLAIYKKINDKSQISVYPALIASSEKIAQVDGSYNAILTLGNNFEWNMMIGRGAGGLTTGSAVVADIVDIACERENKNIFNVDYQNLKNSSIIDISERLGKYFLKFNVANDQLKEKNFLDKFFSNQLISQQIIYKKINDFSTLCAFISNEIKEKNLLEIINKIDNNVIKDLKFIRVENTNF